MPQTDFFLGTAREKEFFGWNWGSEELLAYVVELDLPNDDDVLFRKLVGYLDDITWCERNGLSLTDREYAQYNWDYFCDVVMHRRRFFFLDYGPAPTSPRSTNRVKSSGRFSLSPTKLVCLRSCQQVPTCIGPAGSWLAQGSKHRRSWARRRRMWRSKPTG